MTEKFEALFKWDYDIHNNACLNYSLSHVDTLHIITGYKKAADRLVEEIDSTIDSMSYPIDLMVYPIVFLYRHYIEISLKETMHAGYFLLEDKHKISTGHDLGKLWKEVKKDIAKEIWDEEFPERDFEFIDHLIEEFEKYDRGGDAFRYLKSINGKKHNPELRYINIRHLRDMIEKFDEILSPIDCRISHYSNSAEEFRFRKLNGIL